MRAYRIRLGNLPEDGCGELWEKCREDECVAIGWGELEDLCHYTTDELRTKLREMLGDQPWLGEGWIRMSLPQIKRFCDGCKKDDFIIAYFRRQICGIGQVKEDHCCRNDNVRYSINMILPQTKKVITGLFYHQKKVEWKNFGNFPLKVKDLSLSQFLKNKLNTPPTIIDISSEEWDEITSELNFPV